jgi:hypothetical protein
VLRRDGCQRIRPLFAAPTPSGDSPARLGVAFRQGAARGYPYCAWKLLLVVGFRGSHGCRSFPRPARRCVRADADVVGYSSSSCEFEAERVPSGVVVHVSLPVAWKARDASTCAVRILDRMQSGLRINRTQPVFALVTRRPRTIERSFPVEPPTTACTEKSR